jgi:protein-tyrosine phosphatase
MDTGQSSRILTSAPNFRDIGGYRLSENCFFNKRAIYRSGELSKLTEKDVQKVEELGIRTIIDLRMDYERRKQPDRPFHNKSIETFHIPFCPSDKVPTKVDRLRLIFDKTKDFDVMSREFYHRIAFCHASEIRRVFEILSCNDRLPAIIHCTGGKDRTGILTALIQLSMGVSNEDVYGDYILSNILMRDFVEDIFRKFWWMRFPNVKIERFRPFYEARRDYLEGVLGQIMKEYGSIANYLGSHCGIQPEILDKLNNAMRLKSR